MEGTQAGTNTDDGQQIVLPPEATANAQPLVINISNNNVNTNTNTNTNVVAQSGYAVACSAKSRTLTLILCILFGYLGAHCFYAGRIGRGLLYLFTFGVFGLGWIWDVIQILRGRFVDGHGLVIVN